MRRKNLFKTLIILTALIWSVIVLTPTYMLNQQKQEADNFYAAIAENTTLNRNDIKAALSSGNLELQVRNTFKGTNGNGVDTLIEDVNSLIEVNEKIEENEPQSIKLGLDLQGGTYLVYEVDLPKMFESRDRPKYRLNRKLSSRQTSKSASKKSSLVSLVRATVFLMPESRSESLSLARVSNIFGKSTS